MPILQRFDNARVLMYLDDHPPPHVHVKLRDGRECTVDLNILRLGINYVRLKALTSKGE